VIREKGRPNHTRSSAQKKSARRQNKKIPKIFFLKTAVKYLTIFPRCGIILLQAERAVLDIGCAKLLPLPLAPGLNIRRLKTQHSFGGGRPPLNRYSRREL